MPYDFLSQTLKYKTIFSNLTFETSVSVRTVIKQFLGLSRLISGHVQKFADTNYTNVQPFLGLIIFIASKLFAAANIFIFSLNFSHQKMQRLLKFTACCKKKWRALAVFNRPDWRSSKLIPDSLILVQQYQRVAKDPTQCK